MMKQVAQHDRGTAAAARGFAAQQTGHFGEDAAATLLCSYYRSVHARPLRDGAGTDVWCDAPRFPGIPRSVSGAARFQVKAGLSYRRGIGIASRTVQHYARVVEETPVVFLVYAKPEIYKYDGQERLAPSHFLVFSEWARYHGSVVRRHIDGRSKEPLLVPYRDLLVFTEARFRDAMISEYQRLDPFVVRSAFATRRTGVFPEHYYLFNFPGVVRAWEVPLTSRQRLRDLIGSPQDPLDAAFDWIDGRRRETELDTAFGPTRDHPVRRASAERLEHLQQRMYDTLARLQSGDDTVVLPRFAAVPVAASRALAVKYHRFTDVARRVLLDWRQRPGNQVLIAMQMIGAVSHVAPAEAASLIPTLRGMERELAGRADRLSAFRLEHHVNQALAEITGERKWSTRAVNVARRHQAMEFRHLVLYGWGVGPHLVDWYQQALTRPGPRSDRLHSYNELMLQTMGDWFSSEL